MNDSGYHFVNIENTPMGPMRDGRVLQVRTLKWKKSVGLPQEFSTSMGSWEIVIRLSESVQQHYKARIVEGPA